MNRTIQLLKNNIKSAEMSHNKAIRTEKMFQYDHFGKKIMSRPSRSSSEYDLNIVKNIITRLQRKHGTVTEIQEFCNGALQCIRFKQFMKLRNLIRDKEPLLEKYME